MVEIHMPVNAASIFLDTACAFRWDFNQTGVTQYSLTTYHLQRWMEAQILLYMRENFQCWPYGQPTASLYMTSTLVDTEKKYLSVNKNKKTPSKLL